MSAAQSGILSPPPAFARTLTFRLRPGGDPAAALSALPADEDLLVGLGLPIAAALGATVPGLRHHPALIGAGGEVIPSTQGALWLRVSGGDPGVCIRRAEALSAQLAPGFVLERPVDCFRYREGRDLSGYVDGTENPEGEAAEAAALVRGAGPGLDGASFLAAQLWVHDLARFEAMSPGERDRSIGRRIDDDSEIEDAPESAHIKRTAQEDFEPAAFVLRRSMPWADGGAHGLLFLAFGARFDAYEALLRRMIGLDDGTVDALFRFTRPVGGAYYWCPPVSGGALDLRALGL